MLKKIRVEDAVGMSLAHDVTRVVPGFKGPAFKRGHIIKAEDIPDFLNIGKEHVYVLTLEEGEVHEEEAAFRIAQAVGGEGLKTSGPSEGRVNLVATRKGLVRINVDALGDINSLGDIIIATIHNHTVSTEGMTVAGMRIIPLYIHHEHLEEMEQIAGQHKPVIMVDTFKHKNIGLIITGNEVYSGKIKDRFGPILHERVEALGCVVNNETIVPDDSDITARTILQFQSSGSEIILCTSGMSVDPDDATPAGIRKTGAEIGFYGLPVLPGAMFLYARLNQTHILGVPACVLHAKSTAFDILFPRVLTGEQLTFAGTRQLGHGGLCLGCDECRYPVCPYGK